ncbi:catalase [Bacilli bacterium]|nr:catalase [Bacilli bacterium]
MCGMYDHAITISLRMLVGFCVHTFRFVNDEGIPHFVNLQ